MMKTGAQCLRAATLGLVLAGMSAATTPAQAWTAFGHRLVAKLAQAQLAPDTQTRLDALLALEPGADLVSIASWPDEIRDDPRYRKTGPFHYVNIRDPGCRYVAARDCPQGACIVAALPRFAAILADASQPPQARLDALKFVVHLVGDVHQPLHAGNHDDRGGNQFQVRVGTEGSNLHAVWDYHILNAAGFRLGAYANHLSPQVRAATAGPFDAQAWAESSCALLDETSIYPRRPGKLPKGYLQERLPQVEARIALAAKRLAMVLDQAMLPTSTTEHSSVAGDPATRPNLGH
ncbi:MAG TPA: S1/P1 nuclease [Chiayiivirga sp.]|nr:S1/P1 nuclease [Chiayiivirga sp.]